MDVDLAARVHGSVLQSALVGKLLESAAGKRLDSAMQVEQIIIGYSLRNALLLCVLVSELIAETISRGEHVVNDIARARRGLRQVSADSLEDIEGDMLGIIAIESIRRTIIIDGVNAVRGDAVVDIDQLPVVEVQAVIAHSLLELLEVRVLAFAVHVLLEQLDSAIVGGSRGSHDEPFRVCKVEAFLPLLACFR